ncbi:MAG: stage II sporulation protein P [Halanaerobiales bacterium]
MYSYRKKLFIFIFIIAVILLILNIRKYMEMDDVIVPVWSSHDQEYYRADKNRSLYNRIKDNLRPDNLVYNLTGVRLQVPITYLKNEIPLLSYYTPEELKTPTSTLYHSDEGNDNIIQLKFNLSDTGEGKPENDEAAEIDKLNEDEDKRIYEPDNRPVIAIYHTHTSETYIDDPRPQDNNGHVLPGNIGNVARVGMELAAVLSEEYNFEVIHTTRIHDEKYSRSYYNSRQTVKELLNKNSNIVLLLDIHRDGGKNSPTKEMITTVINQERAAKVMIVVTSGRLSLSNGGSDTNGGWQENMNLAAKIAERTEKMYPGMLMRIEERGGTYNRYNQDLHPHSLILEMGDYHNTTREAIRSAHYMADVIASIF